MRRKDLKMRFERWARRAVVATSAVVLVMIANL